MSASTPPPNAKEISNIFFAHNDMILHVENPKISTKKRTVRISDLSKLARYIINTQKSVVFLHTNNEQSGKEIKKTIPFTIVSEN